MRVSSWKRVGSMSQGSNRQGHRCARWLATAQGEPMEIYLVSHVRTAVGHEDVIHTREREQVALALPEIAGRHHLGYALRCASLAGTSHQGIPRVTRAAIEDRAGFPLCRAIVVGFRWMVDLPGARDDASACVSERTEDEARERSQRAACRVEGTSEETDNVPTTEHCKVVRGDSVGRTRTFSMQLGAVPSLASARRFSAVVLRRQVGGDGGGGKGGGGDGDGVGPA